MPGVGKLLKQAQKMQKAMEAVQADLSAKEIEVSSGGGAVKVVVDGHGAVKSLKLDGGRGSCRKRDFGSHKRGLRKGKERKRSRNVENHGRIFNARLILIE